MINKDMDTLDLTFMDKLTNRVIYIRCHLSDNEIFTK